MTADAHDQRHEIPLPDWLRQHLDTHGPDGLLCVDRAGTVLSWNEALPRLLGEAEPRWTLRSISDLFGWSTDEELESLLAAAAAHGHHRTAAPITAGGRTFEAELTAALVTPPGSSRCFLVYVREAPRAAPPPQPGGGRERMELEIQNRLLLNRAGGLILIVDPVDGALLHANAAAEEYLRASPGKLRGRAVIDVFEGVEAFVSTGDLGVLRTGVQREVELTIPSATGAQWLVAMSGTRIPWHGREALQWVGRDVTDRRAAPPTSGTVRLPISVVTPAAEGLRHPASQIEALARHCLDRPDRPWHELRSRLEQVQELADRVRSTSEDLLYAARVADGSLDVRRMETTVGAVLGAVLHRLERRARAQRVELLTVQVNEEASLFTDPRLLGHALRQVVLRAVDTGADSVTITATRDGDCVRFVVIDAGVAIPAALMARLQDERALAGLAASEPEELAELPLLLAMHFVRVLGGHAEILSAPGAGTRICLTLLG